MSALFMALCLFGNGGFRSLLDGFLEHRRLGKSIARLRADHDVLAQELSRIQQDPAYTEFLIRRDLGYVKKGEVEYRFSAPEKARPK